MMTRYNWLAIALFASLLLTSIYVYDNAALFFNPLGLLVVISGTLGAMFLSYSSSDILASLRVAHNAYTVEPPTTDEIVDTLMDLSVRSRRKGMLALEDAEEETTGRTALRARCQSSKRWPDDTRRVRSSRHQDQEVC